MSEKNRFDIGSAFGEVSDFTEESFELTKIMMARAAVATTVASDRVKRVAEVTKNVAKNAPGIANGIRHSIIEGLKGEGNVEAKKIVPIIDGLEEQQLGDRPPKN